MTQQQYRNELAQAVARFAELREAENQTWEVRDGVIDRRADETDPQERRLLAVAVDFLEEAAVEIGRMASAVYNRKATE